MNNPQRGGIDRYLGGVSSATIVLVAFIVVAGVAIGAIAFFLFGPRSSPGSSPSPAEQYTPSAEVQPEASACIDPPRVEPTSWKLTTDGLAMSVDLSSSCAAATVLSDSRTTITAFMGTRDVAAAVFDLEHDPIAITVGETVSRTFVFPAGMYWRTPELVDNTVDVEMRPSGEPPSVQPTGAGSATLAAADPAPPAHGSEESTATNALRELAAADHPTVQTYLENRWVPQIGSKRIGLIAEGITWTSADILRNHFEFRQRYDDVRLVWSADWTSFNSPDFWVTVVAEPVTTAGQANRWCDSHGIDAFNCFAKMISGTFGTEGTTVLRK